MTQIKAVCLLLLRPTRLAFRLALGLLFLLPGVGLASPQPALVQAAPQGAGTFTITSAADTNVSHPALTLREALLVDRGGQPRPAGSACDVGAVRRQLTDTGLPPILCLPLTVR